MIRWGAGLAFLLIAWSATAASISGTYVGTVPNSTALVQLVQTNDRQVTGRWEITNLQPSGKLETNSFLVTGASDGTTVVLSLKPSALLSDSLTLSGTVDGDTLRLSGSLGQSSGKHACARNS